MKMSNKRGKLIRDKIPEIILKNKRIPKTRTLNKSEYLRELKKKLIEETKELLESKNKKEIINESSDVLEIVDALAEYYGITFEQVVKNKEKKKKERGGFRKKTYLVRIK